MRLLNNEYKWYVAYIKNFHEKKVHNFLIEEGIKSFLPLRKELRYWSDRKKWIDLPLFPRYLFVKISNKEYYKVLEHPSVIRYIYFDGKPAIINDKQIDSVKTVLDSGFQFFVETTPVKIGEKVLINHGPLKGCEGEIVYFSVDKRLVIRLERIGYSINVNINLNNIIS